MAKASVKQHPGIGCSNLVVDTVSEMVQTWDKCKGDGQKSRTDGCGGNSLGKMEINWKERKSRH